MLGDWDFETYEAGTIAVDPETGEFVKTPSPWRMNAAITFFVVFTFVIVVVLLNLLIAIMGDTFDRIRENQELEGRIEKARVLVDIDRSWFWLIKLLGYEDVCFPRCLHALVPVGHTGAPRDAWEGRVKAIARQVDGMKGAQEAAQKKMEKAQEEAKAEINEVRDEVKAMRAEMKELLEKLLKKDDA